MLKVSPKISVIVPVYNSEKYLPRCLDSIVNQTLKDIEIICVDDGSTDNSSKILQQYAARDKRIKFISQENQGLSITRNNGMALARGQYLSFTDSDDWITADMYAKLYAEAERTNADIVQCGYYKYNDKIEKEVLESPLISNDFCTVLDNIKKCYAWNKIWKKEFLQHNNLFFYPKIFYEDLLFNIQALCCRPLWAFISYSGYFYWCSNASSITNNRDKELKRQQDKLTSMKLSLQFARKIISNSEYKYLQNFLIERFIGKNEMSSKKLSQKYLALFEQNSLLRRKWRKFKIKQFLKSLFANKN